MKYTTKFKVGNKFSYNGVAGVILAVKIYEDKDGSEIEYLVVFPSRPDEKPTWVLEEGLLEGGGFIE